jgi:hypothetical protein
LSISSIIQKELKRANKSRIQWLVIDNPSDLSDLYVKDKSSIKEKINGKFNKNELELIYHISHRSLSKENEKKEETIKAIQMCPKGKIYPYRRTIQLIEE